MQRINFRQGQENFLFSETEYQDQHREPTVSYAIGTEACLSQGTTPLGSGDNFSPPTIEFYCSSPNSTLHFYINIRLNFTVLLRE